MKRLSLLPQAIQRRGQSSAPNPGLWVPGPVLLANTHHPTPRQHCLYYWEVPAITAYLFQWHHPKFLMITSFLQRYSALPRSHSQDGAPYSPALRWTQAPPPYPATVVGSGVGRARLMSVSSRTAAGIFGKRFSLSLHW